MAHHRILTLGAAGLLLAGAAGAALAHPHPDGEGDGDGKVERVIVLHDGKEGEHGAKDGKHVRRFEIIGADGHGKPGGPRVRRFALHGDALAHCDDSEKVVDESAGEGDRKTKTVICLKGKPTAATAERLEEALARINTNDELSAEQKARITTALKSAIDRARSAR